MNVQCGSIVQEKEKRVSYSLRAMGTRSTTYWLSNFTFDYFFYLLVVLIIFIGLKLADRPIIVKSSDLNEAIQFLICYGIS